MQYYEVEPFGEERADLRSGQIAAAVYNVNRTKQSQKVLSAVDFLFRFDRVNDRKETDYHMTEEQKWQEDKVRMKAYASVMKANRPT